MKKRMYIYLLNKQKHNSTMAKIRKNEILELVYSGSTLVKKFDRMYGTYFYIINSDATTIYNVHLGDCKTISNMVILKKTMVDPNLFEYTSI